jgi:hypothetical protein
MARHLVNSKRWLRLLLGERVAAYQLVGAVMAHQGIDG